MTNQQKYKQLHKILDDAAVYARTIGKMDFDIQCCAPEEGLPQAGEDIATPRNSNALSPSWQPTTRV